MVTAPFRGPFDVGSPLIGAGTSKKSQAFNELRWPPMEWLGPASRVSKQPSPSVSVCVDVGDAVGVSVAGTGVSVAGTGVSVGVGVSVAGTGVSVGVGVSVAGTA